VKKCLNFFIRPSITFRDDRWVQMEWEVWADSCLFVFTSFIVPVENKKTNILFESFEGTTKFAEEVARKHLKTGGPGGCIPECFVGHYRVKHTRVCTSRIPRGTT
jgi:hypothetical protein